MIGGYIFLNSRSEAYNGILENPPSLNYTGLVYHQHNSADECQQLAGPQHSSVMAAIVSSPWAASPLALSVTVWCAFSPLTTAWSSDGDGSEISAEELC